MIYTFANSFVAFYTYCKIFYEKENTFEEKGLYDRTKNQTTLGCIYPYKYVFTNDHYA